MSVSSARIIASNAMKTLVGMAEEEEGVVVQDLATTTMVAEAMGAGVGVVDPMAQVAVSREATSLAAEVGMEVVWDGSIRH